MEKEILDEKIFIWLDKLVKQWTWPYQTIGCLLLSNEWFWSQANFYALHKFITVFYEEHKRKRVFNESKFCETRPTQSAPLPIFRVGGQLTCLLTVTKIASILALITFFIFSFYLLSIKLVGTQRVRRFPMIKLIHHSQIPSLVSGAKNCKLAFSLEFFAPLCPLNLLQHRITSVNILQQCLIGWAKAE